MSEASATDGHEIVVYTTPDNGPQVEVVIQDETVWLTSRQMSDLFQTTARNIQLHTQNAFTEGELDEEATAKESFVVRSEGGRQVRRRIQRGSRGSPTRPWWPSPCSSPRAKQRTRTS